MKNKGFSIPDNGKMTFRAKAFIHDSGNINMSMSLNNPFRTGDAVTLFDDMPEEHRKTLLIWFKQVEDNPDDRHTFIPIIPEYLEKDIAEIKMKFQQFISENNLKTHMRDGFTADGIRIEVDDETYRSDVYCAIRRVVLNYYDWQIFSMNWVENPNRTYKDFSPNEIHPNAKIVQQGTPVEACRHWFHPLYRYNFKASEVLERFIEY